MPRVLFVCSVACSGGWSGSGVGYPGGLTDCGGGVVQEAKTWWRKLRMMNGGVIGHRGSKCRDAGLQT